jgi:hypothetical protein
MHRLKDISSTLPQWHLPELISGSHLKVVVRTTTTILTPSSKQRRCYERGRSWTITAAGCLGPVSLQGGMAVPAEKQCDDERNHYSHAAMWRPHCRQCYSKRAEAESRQMIPDQRRFKRRMGLWGSSVLKIPENVSQLDYQ